MRAVYGVASQSPVRTAILDRMLRAETHPDGTAFHRVTSANASVAFVLRADTDPAQAILERNGVTIGVVGKIFHDDHRERQHVLSFIYDLYVSDRLDRIEECAGEYNVTIVDSVENVLILLTDYLGIRPLFHYDGQNEFIFGSAVWPMIDGGCIAPDINLDALSGWLCLGHALDDGSLFEQVRKVPGSTIVKLSRGKRDYHTYARFPWHHEDISQQEAIAGIDDIVTRACQRMCAGDEPCGCFLSGGFDSRYLLCVLTRLGLHGDTYTVHADSAEEDIAEEVLAALGLSAQVIRGDRALYDLYDAPFHFGPWGFPMGKFYTMLPVERFNLRHTLVDGLLGDDLIRGYDYETTVERLTREHESPDEAIFRAHRQMEPALLFTAGLSKRIRRRAVSQVTRFRDQLEGSEQRKAYLWVLMNRKCNYHSNNHLQYLDYTDTVHPFYTKELIDFRLVHPNRLFTMGLYRALFERYYPEVSAIPHSSDVGARYSALEKFSYFFWRKAAAIAHEVMRGMGGEILRTGRLLPRVAAYSVGFGREQYIMRHLWPLTMLMGRLRERGMSVNWEEV